MTQTLLPAPRLDESLQSRLTALADERILQPARGAGYELALIGATVLPQQQVISRTEWGTWLFVDHIDDPTARQYGGKIPIPQVEHNKLTALAQAGVRPDLVWLGHQLPDTWRDGDRLDQLVPPPAHLREKDQKLVRRLRTAQELAVRAAGATLAAAAAAAAAPVAALATVGLDPIVLGGVRHPSEPVVVWSVLAQWEWQ